MGGNNEHLDLLRSIETAMVSFYRKDPNLTDFEAIRTYEALLDSYSAEAFGRKPRNWQLGELEANLFGFVKSACDICLGKFTPQTMAGQNKAQVGERTVDVAILIACLKKLIKSAQAWNKRHGKRGYLDFVKNFIA